MPQLDLPRHAFRSPRLAAIAALADQNCARMDADDDAAAEKAAKEKKAADDKAAADKAAADKAAADKKAGKDDSDDAGDGTDWQTLSRKNERRAKENKAAAEKAAEEKAAAEAKAEAAEKRNADILESVAKALGLKDDDTPPDPAKLQQTLGERERDLKDKDDALAAKDQEIADLKAERDATVAAKDVELAAWRVAVKEGVNAGMWLDLRSTEKALAKLDPTDDEFDKQLAELVKSAVKDNEALRVKREPSAGEAGIGTTGGSDDTAVKPGTGRLRAAYST